MIHPWFHEMAARERQQRLLADAEPDLYDQAVRERSAAHGPAVFDRLKRVVAGAVGTRRLREGATT